MIDEASGCVLTYNGEIYNYVELRRLLEADGHRFHSSGDTEVLLRSYLQWGTGCLDRLNGMFAFAVWDPRSRRVLVARDRFGEKPLYLLHAEGRVWFSSEVQALISAGVLRARANHDYIFRFLATGDVGHPTECAFIGPTQLPAAHAAWININGVTDRWRYWKLPQEIRNDNQIGDVSNDVVELVRDSVALRLRSDVEVGTSLSGGTDSSLVLDAIRQNRPDGTLHAFTASFPGSPNDELPAARLLADKLSVTLHPVPLDGTDLARDLVAVVRANERPIESASVVAQYRVMGAAAEAGVTVLLDGQGADETWAGYPKYAAMALTDELATGRLGAARARRSAWRSVHGQSLTPAMARYLVLTGGPRSRRAGWDALRQIWPPWISRTYRMGRSAADPLSGSPLPAAHLGRVASAAPSLDVTRIQLPRLLHYADRNSMAWSREVRLPFLDHRLVELGATTPLAIRLASGWTKEPIRRALEQRGWGDVARRPDKQAFMPPHEQWMTTETSKNLIDDAWRFVAAAGLLATPEPRGTLLVRWRVLALATWAEEFRTSLS